MAGGDAGGTSPMAASAPAGRFRWCGWSCTGLGPVAERVEPGAGAPVVRPHERDSAAVAPGESYLPGDPVWMYGQGGWWPGVVLAVSRVAVLVRYRPGGQPGEMTDTVSADRVATRAWNDPDEG